MAKKPVTQEKATGLVATDQADETADETVDETVDAEQSVPAAAEHNTSNADNGEGRIVHEFESGRQSFDHYCPKCGEKCKAYNSNPFITYYKCQGDKCNYRTNASRPRRVVAFRVRSDGVKIRVRDGDDKPVG